MSTDSYSFGGLTGLSQPREGLKTSTVRAGVFALSAEGIDFLLRLGSLVVLARLLVPEDFGLVSMVTALTGLAVGLKDFGLASAVVQTREITRQQLSTLFWVNVGAGIVMAALVAALTSPIAKFYQEPRLLLIGLAIATTFVWSGAANQHHALLRRTMKYGRIASVQLTASALSIALAIVLSLQGFGYWALVWREVSRSVFSAIGAWICFPWLPGLPSRRAGVGRLIRFGAYITGPNMLSLLTSSLDHVLVGRFFGAQQLGFYRQGVQLVFAPMNQVLYPVRSVAESALSRLQDDDVAYRRYYRNILAALALPTFPVGLFMAVFAEEIVQVVLGAQWLEATSVFRILAIAAFMRPAVSTSGGVMVTCGYSRRFFSLGVVSSAALIVFYVLGLAFGPPGVASAHFWVLWLVMVPQLHSAFRNTPITVRFFLAAISRPGLSAATMVAVLVAVKRAGFVRGDVAGLVLGLAVAPIAYFGAWLAMPGGRAELTRMASNLTAPLRRWGYTPTA